MVKDIALFKDSWNNLNRLNIILLLFNLVPVLFCNSLKPMKIMGCFVEIDFVKLYKGKNYF